MLHSKHGMLLDVQDMSCLLPLAQGPIVASLHKPGVKGVQHVDEPPASPLYIQAACL